ncbi:hypothetical protein ACWIWK_08855 [Helicobacter sp. 23-1048]
MSDFTESGAYNSLTHNARREDEYEDELPILLDNSLLALTIKNYPLSVKNELYNFFYTNGRRRSVDILDLLQAYVWKTQEHARIRDTLESLCGEIDVLQNTQESYQNTQVGVSYTRDMGGYQMPYDETDLQHLTPATNMEDFKPLNVSEFKDSINALDEIDSAELDPMESLDLALESVLKKNQNAQTS